MNNGIAFFAINKKTILAVFMFVIAIFTTLFIGCYRLIKGFTTKTEGKTTKSNQNNNS